MATEESEKEAYDVEVYGHATVRVEAENLDEARDKAIAESDPGDLSTWTDKDSSGVADDA